MILSYCLLANQEMMNQTTLNSVDTSHRLRDTHILILHVGQSRKAETTSGTRSNYDAKPKEQEKRSSNVRSTATTHHLFILSVMEQVVPSHFGRLVVAFALIGGSFSVA